MKFAQSQLFNKPSLFLFWIFFGSTAMAQEDHSRHALTDSRGFHLSLAVAHTYIPETTIDGKETIALPSLGLDIEYYFNHKLGLGLHNDLELLVFELKKDQGNVIRREFPVLLTMDFLYRLTPKFVVFVGPGVELETSENYAVFRLGAEYMAHISDKVSFSPILSYDFRSKAYDTFSIGVGVGLKLEKKKPLKLGKGT